VNIKDAKRVAFGTTGAETLEEYFKAWQWLYDNEVELQEADMNYLDKLICDGNVIPRSNYFSTIGT
jgi:hypothetical protein